MFGQGKGLLGLNMNPQTARAMQAGGLALSQLSAGRPVNLAPLHAQALDDDRRAKLTEAMGPMIANLPPEQRALVAAMPPALATQYLMKAMGPQKDPLAALKQRAQIGGLVPGSPEYQQFILANGQGGGANTAVVEGKLVDKATGRVIADFSGNAGPDFETEQKLRKEFITLPEVKDFSGMRDAWGKIQQAAADGSAMSDMALIFNYMKMLDPGSTVREGEFATVQQAAGVPAQITNLYNQALSGNILNDSQVKEIVNISGRLFNSQASNYNASASRYRKLAEEYNVSPSRIAEVVELYDLPANIAAETLALLERTKGTVGEMSVSDAVSIAEGF